MMTKRTMLAVSIALILLNMCLPVHAQVATLRMNLDDDIFPGALRPKVFTVNRSAHVPWPGASSGDMVSLGEFLARNGERPENLGKKIDINGAAQDRSSTALFASSDRSTLCLEIRSIEPFPSDMAKKLDTYFPDDRIDVYLDMNHDHYSFTRISVMPDGYSEQASYTVRDNHLLWDRGHARTKAELKYTARTSIGERGWILNLDVTLPRMDGDAGPGAPWRVIGLNVVRYRSVGGEEVTMWCPDHNNVAAPLYFGDLYLGDAPAMVTTVTLGTVCRGLNNGRLAFSQSAQGMEIEASSYNKDSLFASDLFRANGDECRFSWTMDPLEQLFGTLRLTIDGGYWGGYEFGWRKGLLMTLDPGVEPGAQMSKKPSPGEDDYYWKYSRYILDRLPEFERTADGLGLRSDTGVYIDLKDGGFALDKLAQIVMDAFPSDEERIAGAALLLCQEGLMVSSATGERLAQRFGGLGVLRIGGAFCSGYAELLRDVVNRMKDSGGKPFNACVVNFKRGPSDKLGWPNHWVGGVAYGGGVTLIDAELGLFFIDPANGRLVTLQQLIEQPELAERSAHGLSEYFKDRPLGDFYVREYGDLWNEWIR